MDGFSDRGSIPLDSTSVPLDLFRHRFSGFFYLSRVLRKSFWQRFYNKSKGINSPFIGSENDISLQFPKQINGFATEKSVNKKDEMVK